MTPDDNVFNAFTTVDDRDAMLIADVYANTVRVVIVAADGESLRVSVDPGEVKRLIAYLQEVAP